MAAGGWRGGILSARLFRERERRRKEGIPVDRAVYDQLRALADRAVK
jgi:LDH2 family malate/lactate/ureidoglycolate dehydrogenase